MSPQDLSARMHPGAARARPARPGTEEPPPPPATAEASPTMGEPRTPAAGRTHRVTVDLDDGAYAFLRRTALDWFVPGSAILRALIAEMASDPDLAERVRSRTAQR
jgi:hypothetical protein